MDTKADLLRDRLREHLQELCLRIGGRHVGSPGERLAAEYIEKAFRKCGYSVVKEGYPTVGWEAGSFSFLDLSSGLELPESSPCFFSNPVTVEDRLLVLGPRELEDLERQPVRGRLCMANMQTEVGKVFGRNRIAESLDRLGAAAAIFISDHFEIENTKIQRSPFLKRLGAAAVSGRSAMRLLASPEHLYRLSFNGGKFKHRSVNVVARAGRGRKRIVFGSHYDTAPFVQGASDNASGVAILLEVARLLRKDCKASGWTVDFAAFSAEEYIPCDFPPGSGDYVRRHKGEDIRCFINFDGVGCALGTETLQAGLAERLPSLDDSPFPMLPYSGDGDDKAFHAAGTPTLWYRTESNYKKIHTKSDSYEFIDAGKMAAVAVEAARMARKIMES